MICDNSRAIGNIPTLCVLRPEQPRAAGVLPEKRRYDIKVRSAIYDEQ
jgi:hypothetical protein